MEGRRGVILAIVCKAESKENSKMADVLADMRVHKNVLIIVDAILCTRREEDVIQRLKMTWEYWKESTRREVNNLIL